MTIGRWTNAAALLGALALAGCDPADRARPAAAPAPEPTADPQASLKAEERLSLNIITKVCPKLPADIPAIKIMITDLSPKKIGHDTGLFKSTKDGTSSTGDKLQDIKEAYLKTIYPTRLDLDAAPFLKKAGDVLLIEIELADANADFFPGPLVVTAGDDAGKAMFCIRDAAHPILAKPGDRKVAFYAQYIASKSKTPEIGKYSVVLIAKDGQFRTPVVLDPKVRNSGFDS